MLSLLVVLAISSWSSAVVAVGGTWLFGDGFSNGGVRAILLTCLAEFLFGDSDRLEDLKQRNFLDRLLGDAWLAKVNDVDRVGVCGPGLSPNVPKLGEELDLEEEVV